MINKLKLKNINIFYIVIFLFCLLKVTQLYEDDDFSFLVNYGREELLHGNFYPLSSVIWGSKGISNNYADHEVLSSMLFYISTLIPFGVLLLKLCISCIFGFILCKYIKYFSKDKNLNCTKQFFILIGTFVVSMTSLQLKAYVFSIIFMMLEIILLYEYKSNFSKKHILYALILVILWNNFHSGSIVMFFVIAGLFWLTNLRDKRTLLLGLACAFALIINPYGYKLILFDFSHFSNSVMMKYINEWFSLDLKTALGKFAGIAFIVLLFSINKYNGSDYFLKFGGFIIALLCCCSIRHLMYSIVFIVPLVCGSDIDFKYLRTFEEYYDVLIIACILVLSFTSVYTVLYKPEKSNFKSELSKDLQEILLETNSESSDGFFNANYCTLSSDIITLGILPFWTSDYPANEERWLDSNFITHYAGDSYIRSFIDKYKITKLLINKYNYLNEERVYSYSNLYCYLIHNPNYELLYDNDKEGLCYFVEK